MLFRSDEGNLVSQSRRRPEREINLDFSVDEDEDEGENEDENESEVQDAMTTRASINTCSRLKCR